jgi:hypothetical protein
MSAGHRMIRASGSTAPAVSSNLVRAQAMLPGVYLEELRLAEHAHGAKIRETVAPRVARDPLASLAPA